SEGPAALHPANDAATPSAASETMPFNVTVLRCVMSPTSEARSVRRARMKFRELESASSAVVSLQRLSRLRNVIGATFRNLRTSIEIRGSQRNSLELLCAADRSVEYRRSEEHTSELQS